MPAKQTKCTLHGEKIAIMENEQRHFSETVGRIEQATAQIPSLKTSIDLLSQSIDNQTKEFSRLADEKKLQNGRIAKLEQWKWYVIGIAVGAAFAANLIADILVKK